jgi:hypothetical protein
MIEQTRYAAIIGLQKETCTKYASNGWELPTGQLHIRYRRGDFSPGK